MTYSPTRLIRISRHRVLPLLSVIISLCPISGRVFFENYSLNSGLDCVVSVAFGHFMTGVS